MHGARKRSHLTPSSLHGAHLHGPQSCGQLRTMRTPHPTQIVSCCMKYETASYRVLSCTEQHSKQEAAAGCSIMLVCELCADTEAYAVVKTTCAANCFSAYNGSFMRPAHPQDSNAASRLPAHQRRWPFQVKHSRRMSSKLLTHQIDRQSLAAVIMNPILTSMIVLWKHLNF